MKRFVRWMRYVILWALRMPVAPHYWSALMLVVIAFAVTWWFGWSEAAARLSGVCLQLLGVLTVVWGILKTRADFGQPTVRSQFQRWIKDFPSYHPRIIEASMNGVNGCHFFSDLRCGRCHLTPAYRNAEEVVRRFWEDHNSRAGFARPASFICWNGLPLGQ